MLNFLPDIAGKKKEPLDLSRKPIGFEEERLQLRVKKKKTPPANFSLEKLEKIEASASVLKTKKKQPAQGKTKHLPVIGCLDLYTSKSTYNLKSLYRVLKLSPRQFWVKKELFRFGAIAFLAVFLLNLVGAYASGQILKKDLEARAFGAYNSVKQAVSAAQSADFMEMYGNLQNANQVLRDAEQSLNANLSLNVTALDSPLKDITLVLSAGRHLTQAGVYLAKTGFGFASLPENLGLTSASSTTKDIQPQLKMTDNLKKNQRFLASALTEITQAQANFSQIQPENLPAELKNKLPVLTEKLNVAQKALETAQNFFPLILDLLGDRVPKRYLILLQNNHEARATGGFIGSYLLLDLNDGQVEKFEFKDIYERDGQFNAEVEPPPGLHKITRNWRMRDANYFPDFPTSAQKIMWFLEQEKGPTVDAVVAINQRIVENLLTKIGPVSVPALNLDVTGENFTWIFSYLTEAKLSSTQTPKQFLADFVPLFLAKAQDKHNLPAILATLEEAIEQKDLLAYASDPDLRQLIETLGFDGKMKNLAQSDYLQVTNTSIGGNKSDGFIKQTVEHQTNVDSAGRLIDHLIITRQHTWHHAEDALFERLYRRFGSGKLDKQELKDILGFGGNRNLMRVYVPLGAKLLTATGAVSTEKVMVYADGGKTVFAFEEPIIYTERELSVKLSYLLPQKLNLNQVDQYRFFAQVQPGQEETILTKKMYLAGDGRILQNFPAGVMAPNEKESVWTDSFYGDEYFAFAVGE